MCESLARFAAAINAILLHHSISHCRGASFSLLLCALLLLCRDATVDLPMNERTGRYVPAHPDQSLLLTSNVHNRGDVINISDDMIRFGAEAYMLDAPVFMDSLDGASALGPAYDMFTLGSNTMVEEDAPWINESAPLMDDELSFGAGLGGRGSASGLGLVGPEFIEFDADAPIPAQAVGASRRSRKPRAADGLDDEQYSFDDRLSEDHGFHMPDMQPGGHPSGPHDSEGYVAREGGWEGDWRMVHRSVFLSRAAGYREMLKTVCDLTWHLLRRQASCEQHWRALCGRRIAQRYERQQSLRKK